MSGQAASAVKYLAVDRLPIARTVLDKMREGAMALVSVRTEWLEQPTIEVLRIPQTDACIMRLWNSDIQLLQDSTDLKPRSKKRGNRTVRQERYSRHGTHQRAWVFDDEVVGTALRLHGQQDKAVHYLSGVFRFIDEVFIMLLRLVGCWRNICVRCVVVFYFA